MAINISMRPTTDSVIRTLLAGGNVNEAALLFAGLDRADIESLYAAVSRRIRAGRSGGTVETVDGIPVYTSTWYAITEGERCLFGRAQVVVGRGELGSGVRYLTPAEIAVRDLARSLRIGTSSFATAAEFRDVIATAKAVLA